jgi:hypothetical protein
VIKLINDYVPFNATQRMYNIQYILLLKLQNISTILSGHHQVNTKLNKCSIELQVAFTSHMGPYLQLFLLDNTV